MRPNFDEIAKITRDLNYAYIAGYKRLIGKDDILALKGGGDLKLYETVAQDDQVKSCVQQRISAVISRDWGVEPGDDSKPAQQAAEFIEQELKNLQWDRINEKMLWGSFYGYSVGEIMWRRGDKIGIDDIKVRNRRRFNFGTDLQPKLITLEDPLGEDLPDQKFWHFCCGGDNDDDPYGRGLAHWLYWPTFFKRSDMRWWVTFLEKYAQPTRLGKYSPGASESDKDTLWQAMDAFGTNGKMMIPEGTMIELLEAARAGGADYQGMLDICNAAISKIVLSQTMTTDNGSSESQANVHQDVKDDIVKADADLVCSSFNEGPVKWLIDWNFPGVAYPRVWRQMDAAVDLTAEADRDTKLQGLGISLKPESIAAKYGDDYLIPDNKEQIPQLNGEQVNALVSIVSNAKQGGWSPELVAGMINGAFPNWPDEAVVAITKNLGSDQPAEPVKPSKPVDLDAVSAQFAEAEFKMKEGTTKEKNGVAYVLTNSRWRRVEPKAKSTGKGKTKLSEKSKEAVADVKTKSGVASKAKAKNISKAEPKPKPEFSPDEISSAMKDFGLGDKAINLGAAYNTSSTIRKARSVLPGSQLAGNALGVVSADKKRNLAAARSMVSFDMNRGVTLGKIDPKVDPAVHERKLNAIASTMRDGDTMQFIGKKGHPLAEKLGLSVFNPEGATKNSQAIYTGVVKNGKLAGVSQDAANAINDIRVQRRSALEVGLNAAQARGRMEWQDEDMKRDLKVYIRAREASEDRIFEKIDSLENEALGRKPSETGDFAAYEAKADKWSRAKFGDFNAGANGFSLEQTKAHDVAHPITHELTGMDSDKIHAHFGKMTDSSGTKTLHAEEAVVNALEQMSRGASLEQAILNGARLARVTTRSDANPNKEHMAYVRSPEFVEKLSEIVHKAYRSDNYAPLMAHVRKSNRISGTVQKAGDNFSGTASGG